MTTPPRCVVVLATLVSVGYAGESGSRTPPPSGRTSQVHEARTKPGEPGKSAANLGVTAQNGKFSNFGTYLQRIVKPLQLEWETLLRTSRTRPPSGTHVTVPFVLNSSGALVRFGPLDPTSEKLAGQIATAAIINCAPFGAWSDDMKRTLNAEEELLITFYYP